MVSGLHGSPTVFHVQIYHYSIGEVPACESAFFVFTRSDSTLALRLGSPAASWPAMPELSHGWHGGASKKRAKSTQGRRLEKLPTRFYPQVCTMDQPEFLVRPLVVSFFLSPVRGLVAVEAAS